MDYTPKYLIFVSPDNKGVDSNKYYRMTPNGDTFTVEFGRVGATPQTKTYPMSKWNSTLSSKLKKGYVDRSDLMQEVIADSKVVDKPNVEEFNKNLNELFIIVPRKMKRVSDCLVSNSSEYDKKLSEEQSLLDTMAGQVYKPKAKIADTDSEIKASESILQKMGITMEDVTQDEIARIKKAMGDSANKFYKAWRVTNLETEKNYQKFTSENNIGNVKLLCHGSRNQNWFGILKMGLRWRLSNVIVNGSMFGSEAIYFSNPDKFQGGVRKSIGYTSLGGYWTHDYQNCGFLAFFDVALGDSYDVYKFDSQYYNMNLKKLKSLKPDAWHLWAHGNTNMLKNDELVVYSMEQMTIRYLVEIR